MMQRNDAAIANSQGRSFLKQFQAFRVADRVECLDQDLISFLIAVPVCVKVVVASTVTLLCCGLLFVPAPD